MTTHHTSATDPGPDGGLLVLWDLDGVLVDIGTLSHECFAAGFTRCVGQPLRSLPSLPGRTDRAILADILTLHGLPLTELDALMAAVSHTAGSFRERIRVDGRVLPGAADAIAALARVGAAQTVVTGNLSAIARAKLEALGLNDGLELTIGGFGHESTDRADLVQRARERAEAAHHTPFPGQRTVVVGDTPHDITGAHRAGARAVGVATGAYSTDDLARAGADAVLTSLTDPTQVLAAAGRQQ